MRADLSPVAHGRLTHPLLRAVSEADKNRVSKSVPSAIRSTSSRSTNSITFLQQIWQWTRSASGQACGQLCTSIKGDKVAAAVCSLHHKQLISHWEYMSHGCQSSISLNSSFSWYAVWQEKWLKKQVLTIITIFLYPGGYTFQRWVIWCCRSHYFVVIYGQSLGRMRLITFFIGDHSW